MQVGMCALQSGSGVQNCSRGGVSGDRHPERGGAWSARYGSCSGQGGAGRLPGHAMAGRAMVLLEAEARPCSTASNKEGAMDPAFCEYLEP